MTENPNTVITGDCRTVLEKSPDEFIDLIIADPPYGDTSLKWDKKSDDWVPIAFPKLSKHGSMWVFGSMRYFLSMGQVFKDAGFEICQDIVWEKHNGSGFASDRFKRVHEHVVQFRRKDSKWSDIYNDVQVTMDARKRVVRTKKRPPHMGQIGGNSFESIDGGPRLCRSVIFEASCHGFAIHPTQKPVGLLEILIKTSCPKHGLVGDLFAGSASVGVAAHLNSRRYFGVEIDPEMAKKANQRLRSETDQGKLFQ